MLSAISRITRRALLAAVAGFMVALPLGVHAAKDQQAPVLSRIAESGTIRVGMSGNQAPFNVRNKEGKIIGMDVDLAGLLARALNVKLQIVDMPFSQLLPALESGKVDLIISGMTATLRRNMRAAFVGPYHITGKLILARSETVAALGSSDLNQESMRIAALAGSTSEDFVKSIAPDAKLVATQNYDEAVEQLLANKVQLFVADAAIVGLTILRYPDAGLVAASKPLTVEPIGIAVPPGDPLLLNLVENYLAALEGGGVLEELHKKWFQSGGWLLQLP